VSTEKNDGVPAFPYEFKFGDGTAEREIGMTLRDYFAAKAMSTVLHGAVLPTKADRDEWLPKLAEIAYETADAMLKAREA
jgi:hypothetical protein